MTWRNSSALPNWGEINITPKHLLADGNDDHHQVIINPQYRNYRTTIAAPIGDIGTTNEVVLVKGKLRIPALEVLGLAVHEANPQLAFIPT